MRLNIPLNKRNLSASALLVSLFILTGLFIIAFGVGYLSFFNTKTSDVYQQSAKARAAALAGVEKFKWEKRQNNFDLATGCEPHFMEVHQADGSYFYLKCTPDINGWPTVQAVGVYKSSNVTLGTGYAYDITWECNANFAIGSLCGGGVLFAVNPMLVAAPSGCTDPDGAGCDNSYQAVDTLVKVWDNTDPGVQTDALDEEDGRNNAALLVGESRYEAAVYCDSLFVNNYGDWYLPAKNELFNLYLKSNYCDDFTVGGEPVGCSQGDNAHPVVGGFNPDTYQTSNESNDYPLDQNWWVSFYDGSLVTNGKMKDVYVRCVRRPS